MTSAPDFERLFEATPALIMVLAPDPPRFTILAASDAYLRAVKKRREDFIGRPVFEALAVGPGDRTSEPNSRASFERVLQQRAPDSMEVQRHDIERSAAEGGGFEARYWSPVNTPVLDEHGAVRYILHRVEDVTEFIELKQKGAEQQALSEALRTRMGAMEVDVYRRAQEIQEANHKLREANSRLAELDRAKTVFFSNISHEFRTPLTVMLGTLEELLGQDGMAEGARRALLVTQRNSLRLLRLVNALLDFSRIEAGRMTARYRPTDVAGLTASLASGFESLCQKAGLGLRVDCPPLPKPVYVDPEMWERIVLNLVSNAFKFTLDGEIEVMLRDVGACCELSVRDTGSGIPQAELPRVFERFHRVDGASGRSVEGTGIGLALVKELVELHGGTIGVASDSGRGTKFWVRVPFGAAHLPADRVAEATNDARPGVARALLAEAASWVEREHEHHPAPGDGRERACVLVAEDNADLRAYLCRLLGERFEVDAYADGLAALESARGQRPDLVLSDVMMPRLDGFGLLAALRADAGLRTVPFILLSARAGEEAMGEGLEAGADDYVMKPFSARELLSRVSASLRLARAREAIERAAAREEALRDADRRKDEFLAVLSHELRNPLAPIKNSLYILGRATPGGAQARRAQQVIERQVTHLTRMVEDLLDLSRITQGKLEVHREPLELNDLVRGVVEDARASFDRSGVGLEVTLGSEPLYVQGDATRLVQVIHNLLDNAAKFTPNGGHTWLSVEAEGDGTAVLRVRDDGTGMPMDLVEHLFQPFVQADRTIAHRTGGLGLGLAIVKGLVEAHGGAISARSAGPGTGTEMLVRLPLRQVRSNVAARATEEGVQPRRVLIIEDNPDAAQSLKEVLEFNGYEVALATDGKAGVQRARALHPEAVICDIGLPEMDGYAVARAIRSDPTLEAVCLVAVTGYAALDDVGRSRAAGFDHHFAKPPDPTALERTLIRCRTRDPERPS